MIMKRLNILLALVLHTLCCSSFAQSSLEVEGSVLIGNTEEANPAPGTMRWTGNNFEGWNGHTWRRLTSFEIADRVTDIDGNEYITVQIGNQEWFAQDLRTTRYNGGSIIPQENDDQQWGLTSDPAWCWYDGDSIHDFWTGKLYNHYAVTNGSLCPSGWRVPTFADFEALEEFIGFAAGIALKENQPDFWVEPRDATSNASSFTGRGGGLRESNGNYSDFGRIGGWWGSGITGFGALGVSRHLVYDDYSFDHETRLRNEGKSVRCIKE